MDMNQNGKSSAPLADWQFATVRIGSTAPIDRFPAPMADSFNHTFWGHPLVPQNSGFSASSSVHCVTTAKPPAMSSRGMFLPAATAVLHPTLSHFPTDSAFVERAARFSCFNGGNISSLVGSPTPAGAPYQLKKTEHRIIMNQVEQNAAAAVPVGGPREGRFIQGSRSANANSSDAVGDSSPSDLGTNKRKRIDQDIDTNQVQQAAPSSLDATDERPDAKMIKAEENSAKSSGKNSKVSPGAPKEDYVHVRARRGQATNSHSLAERVRREKISERMKYLQDLVPGCSKVTGKAVMLDEIINYVQSLQRQVEFLSMKLAAVNRRPDYNIENLLAKDGAVKPQLHPCQQPNGFSCMVNPSDAFRNAMKAQLSIMSEYTDPTLQMQDPWNKELNNSMQQMAYDRNAPLNAQEPGRKPCENNSMLMRENMHTVS